MMVYLELGSFPFKKTWGPVQLSTPLSFDPTSHFTPPYTPTGRLIPYIIGSFLLIFLSLIVCDI